MKNHDLNNRSFFPRIQYTVFLITLNLCHIFFSVTDYYYFIRMRTAQFIPRSSNEHSLTFESSNRDLFLMMALAVIQFNFE